MQGHIHRLWPLMLGLVITACSDSPLPIEHETEHLRIGTQLEGPLCNGDLLAYEALIGDIEHDLNLEMKNVATVYIWDEESWWASASRACPAETYGCYNRLNHTINTIMYTVEHEIVHAVVDGDNVGWFFSEAIANVYSGDQSQFGETSPSASIDLSGRSVDYVTANHFLRWLRERWGDEKVGELANSNSSGSKAFEKIYGMTIEDAELLYFEEAPFQYSSLYTCNGAPLLQPTPGEPHWQETVALDCPTGEDTRASGIGMIVHRTFEISEPGYYTIAQDGYWFDIYRCSSERIEDAILPGSYLTDDVPPEHAGFPDGDYRHYEGQPSWDLYMEAGKHDIGVGLLGHETGTVTLEITPTLGPHPPPPN